MSPSTALKTETDSPSFETADCPLCGSSAAAPFTGPICDGD